MVYIDREAYIHTKKEVFMKILRNTVIITFIVGGLIFARTGKDVKKTGDNNLNVKNQHYWVKDYSDNDNKQLDRKRSHKRRRKIRKPVKGLR